MKHRAPEEGYRRGTSTALAAALLAACGSAQTEPEAPIVRGSPSTLEGESRRVRSFSDMDPVWSLASTSEHLWVATPGGLLRYPLSGGEPLRVSGDVGPGGDRFVSVSDDGEDGVWALSEGGLARYHHGAWSQSAGTVPDVGEVTAMTTAPGGALVVGGSRGLAVYEGGRWGRLSESAHVTALTVQHGAGGGVWAGTRDAGAWLIRPDATLAEHRRDRGMPCDAVRALVPGRGGLGAICSRDDGAVLVRFDGTRWEGYTAPVPGGVSDLASCGEGRVVLATELGLYRISQRHVDEELAPGEVLLASVERGEPARPRSYRASTAEAPGAEGERGAKGRPAPRPFAPPPPPAPEEDEEEEDVPRPILRRVDVAVPEGTRVVACDSRGIWVGTEGLGVVRAMGRGRVQAYRTLDLLASARPFTVAVDARGRAWLLTRDERAGVLGDAGFTSETVEPDPTAGVRLLAFGARGLGAYALGQVRGSPTVRIYRLGDDGWSRLLSRRISVADEAAAEGAGEGGEEEGAGEASADPAFEITFFRVDPGGRFWLGLSERVSDRSTPVRRGVAVIDRRAPEVTYHRQSPRGPGAVRVPDEVAAVAFTRAGDAWLGGLSGAVMVRLDGEVQRYGESNGLLGDIVNDIAMDGSDTPWVATPAGVGRFIRGRWHFFLDALPRGARVTTLAIDSQGEVWGGGPRGGVHFDGEMWEFIGAADGLVSEEIRSVHVDGSDRVWFVTDDGLSLLERRE